MASRKETAVALKRSGQYNCAQSVACAFSDCTGLDEATVRRATGAFGLGMGCMEGTCGALTGAGLVLGLLNDDRSQAMQRMRMLMTRFQERNGATRCKELKGIESGVVLRACNDCVADAAELLDELLENC